MGSRPHAGSGRGGPLQSRSPHRGAIRAVDGDRARAGGGLSRAGRCRGGLLRPPATGAGGGCYGAAGGCCRVLLRGLLRGLLRAAPYLPGCTLFTRQALSPRHPAPGKAAGCLAIFCGELRSKEKGRHLVTRGRPFCCSRCPPSRARLSASPPGDASGQRPRE